MARIVDGPQITGQVVHKQTGQAYGPVTVTVSKTVYSDPEMQTGVTTLTTNGQGVFSCYAQPGTYTFTTTAVDAAPIEAVEVLGRELGINAPGSAASSGSGFAVTGSTDGVSMTLSYTATTWGISVTTGCPYYNDANVTAGDEAIFTVGSDGSLALVQL